MREHELTLVDDECVHHPPPLQHFLHDSLPQPKHLTRKVPAILDAPADTRPRMQGRAADVACSDTGRGSDGETSRYSTAFVVDNLAHEE